LKPASYRVAALIAAGLLVAACGSSSSSRTVPAASAGGTTGGTSTSASARSGYGGGSSQTPASASSTRVVAKQNKLGEVVAVGPKKLTVYMFEGDKGSTSSCTGACAQAWPPVPASGTPSGTAPAQTALIGTTTRSDGTKQLTYKGHALYYFVKDKDDGDAYGEGVKEFGANWYVLKPDGSKVDKS
jgi:predicted lipoprotein with Yx(FWY)xxD motif